MSAAPLLRVENLSKWFPAGRAVLRAVDRVSFTIGRGEVLGLVGESGSGKTTVGRTVLRVYEPDEGRIELDGIDIAHLSPRALKPHRRRLQLVFQDPFGSLNPRMTVEQAIAEPLLIQHLSPDRRARRERVAELLRLVGLPTEAMARYPHEFSGGQRQRIGIARALASNPELLVADEPVSALDVSIQAQVVNLLLELRKRLGLAMLFIAHDLAVVEHIADRIAVMYLGHIVELAESRELVRHPLHPYTEALLSAVPVPEPGAKRARIVLQGEVPSPVNPPSGCVFRNRCRYALPACGDAPPALREVIPGHWKACIRDDIL
ncbi:MAG TPA: ABC transporter ATP-binding protein [Acetobacteraceae bacterium]|nr:ABC transporter ATP-binding protein [Acetobacteraceae bacterium]